MSGLVAGAAMLTSASARTRSARLIMPMMRKVRPDREARADHVMTAERIPHAQDRHCQVRRKADSAPARHLLRHARRHGSLVRALRARLAALADALQPRRASDCAGARRAREH